MSILLSTSYLPPVSVISACDKAEEVVIEGFETYTKQTLRNHCEVYGPNGRQKLSIPVYKVNGNHTMVKDVRISYADPWQKIHWRSVVTAYNNSPFFLYYRDHFEPFYVKRYDHLLEFNTGLLKVIFSILEMDKTIRFTDHYMKHPDILTDKRSFVNRKKDPAGISFPEYHQTFNPKSGFLPDLSIIDLIFNLGPETADYLQAMQDLKDSNTEIH